MREELEDYMSESGIEKIAVIGTGFMGSGIAQVCAMAGKKVVVHDSQPESQKKAIETIRWSLEKLKSKGKFAGNPDETMGRIQSADNLDAVADADMVVEAVYEMIPVKQEMLGKLVKIVGEDIIIGSNTSSVPMAELSKIIPNPERFIGTHFFGPVPLMALLEIVMGPETSEGTLERVKLLSKEIGKTPIVVSKPSPGFLVNRIFNATMGEALRCYFEGIGTPQDIDTGMKLGYGWAAGPFEVIDNAGLDIMAGVISVMGGELPPQIKEMLEKGHVGRKAGQGFYKYDKPGGKKITEKD